MKYELTEDQFMSDERDRIKVQISKLLGVLSIEAELWAKTDNKAHFEYMSKVIQLLWINTADEGRYIYPESK